MELKQFYEQVIRLVAPWKASNVKVSLVEREVTMTLSFESQIYPCA